MLAMGGAGWGLVARLGLAAVGPDMVGRGHKGGHWNRGSIKLPGKMYGVAACHRYSFS